MKAVVVGASGFLGSQVAKTLARRGAAVYGTWFKHPERVPPGLAGSFPTTNLASASPSPDVVFLCAARIPYGAMETPSDELVQANVELPRWCLSTFPRSRLAFASSVAVYGEGPSPRNESTPCAPLEGYGRSKLSAEESVRQGHSYAIVRFTSLYGDGMSAPTFLPRIVKDARMQRRIVLHGNGERTQDYLHVDDAAELMVRAAAHGKSGTFLGASGVAVSNLRAATLVAEALPGTRIEFQGEDKTPGVSYDPAQTFAALGFTPSIAFEDGIRRLAQRG